MQQYPIDHEMLIFALVVHQLVATAIAFLIHSKLETLLDRQYESMSEVIADIIIDFLICCIPIVNMAIIVGAVWDYSFKKEKHDAQ